MTWNGEVPSISRQVLIETNISYLPQRAVMVPTSGCGYSTSELRIIPDLELISQYLTARLALKYKIYVYIYIYTYIFLKGMCY